MLTNLIRISGIALTAFLEWISRLFYDEGSPQLSEDELPLDQVIGLILFIALWVAFGPELVR